MNPILQTVPVTQSILLSKLEKSMSTLRGFGIAEIVLGGICVVLDIIIIIVDGDIGQGIWCGSVLIACGIVGLNVKPNACMYTANMAMSIVSAIFMAALVMFSGFYASHSYRPSAIAIQCIIAVASFAALVINIVHAAYCCAGTRNLNDSTQMVDGQVVCQIQQMSGADAGTSNMAMSMSPEVSHQKPTQANNDMPPAEFSADQAPTRSEKPSYYSLPV